MFWRKWFARRGVLGPLTSLLKKRNDDVRLKAAVALSELTNPKVVPPLILCLEDVYVPTRDVAAKALGKFEDPQAVEPLKSALRDPEQDIRISAAKSLLAFDRDAQMWGNAWLAGEGSKAQVAQGRVKIREAGKEAFIPVRAALSEGNWQVRATAAQILGELGDDRAIEPLCTMLKDNDSDARRSAATSLGQLRSHWAIEPLTTVLGDIKEDVAVRKAAALALAKFDPPDSHLGHAWALAVGSPSEKETAEKMISEAGEFFFDPLVSALQKGYWTVRRAAADALALMNDARAVPPLIDALEDEDWQVRLAATVALGELGDLSAYKPLCSMLKDDHWKVCADAAKSIGRLKVPESIVILMKLTKDPQPEVRAAAVYGLGNLGDPQAVKPVIGGLKDPHEYMRQACASVLGDLGSHRAVDPLCETLKDLNDDVRAQAAGSLGKLKDRRAFKPLVEALNDWYSGVCSASAQSLLLLGPPEDLWGYAWLMGGSEDDTEKEKAIGHIRDAGEGALQALLDCLSDWHNSVRCAAATALGELKHSSAVQPLCAEATKSPLNDEVINYMFQALAAIKQPGTGVLLSQALDNAMFQSEDLPLVKKLLNYTRQLSKASWMTELDKKGVVEIHEKLLKR